LVPANGAIVCLLMVAMFGMLVVLQFTSFEFNSIRITSMTRAVFAYGYLNSWIAEFFLAPDTSAIARQLAELQKVSPDRLRGTEPAWPVGDKIAIVQLESFGWNTLNYRLNGREVTPFFNKLARSSRIFRLQAYHNIGTAEMDYAVLSCGTPSPQMISYFVPDVDYSNALPRFMSKRGFETVSLHGATGEFYSRRGNFERMGFNEIHFREDFRGRDVKQSYWGVRDEELFRHSAERMRNNASPQFHFIITLDTHGPFNLIKEEEKTVFPDSTMLEENYFNSLAAVDEKIREYVESLPEGTTLIFYGDHTAGVVYGDYAPARVGEAEFVPCLVLVTGSDASWMSTAPREDSQPDDLRILDIVNHLRRQVERNVPVGSGQSKVASLS
jgi:hypothetical protein